jgi:uncharacterized phosphosugar-binding protein
MEQPMIGDRNGNPVQKNFIHFNSETHNPQGEQEMGAKLFYTEFQKVFDRLQSTQEGVIQEVAIWAADAITADRFVFLFGTGHSALPTMDAYPRIGCYPGWYPLHELSTAYIANTLGNQGLRQTLFIEKTAGFGQVMLENYRLDPKDLMIVISNSGVNTMGVDVALEAKQQGLKTVAVTSIEHSKVSKSYHPSGKRLYEVCDRTIDTCMPQGDALVEVSGFGHKVAAASTIMGCIVLQSLVAETAKELASRGVSFPVFPSHNTKLSHEEMEKVEAMAEAVLEEHARRTTGLYK